MFPWWPAPARDAWNALDPRWRGRARTLFACLDARFGGFVVGQTRLLEELRVRTGMPITTGRRTLERLVDAGLLRRRLADGKKVVWAPEHLLDGTVAPLLDELPLGAAEKS